MTLRLAVYGDRAVVAGYKAMALAYQRKTPNVTVDVEAASSASAARARLQRQFAAGDPPDLFLADSRDLPDLVAAQRVQPVDTLLENRGVQFGDHYERLGLEAFAENSSLQCMPNDVSPLVVFYNQLLVDVSSLTSPGQPPLRPEANGWSWADFVAAAEQSAQGRVKGVYLPPSLTTLAPLVGSAGGSIVDDPVHPHTLTLSDSSIRPVVKRIVSLSDDPAFSPSPAQIRETGALKMFERGRLAMMVGTRSLVPTLRRHHDLTFDVYPLPGFGRSQTVADSTGYCLSSASKHTEAAADLLTFASSDEGSRLTTASGGIVPANLDVRNSDTFLQPDKFPISGGVFTRVMRRATTMPNPPGWPEMVRDTQPMLDRLFNRPGVRLGRLLPRIDQQSAALLTAATASPSPSGSPSGSTSSSGSTSPSG